MQSQIWWSCHRKRYIQPPICHCLHSWNLSSSTESTPSSHPSSPMCLHRFFSDLLKSLVSGNPYSDDDIGFWFRTFSWWRRLRGCFNPPLHLCSYIGVVYPSVVVVWTMEMKTNLILGFIFRFLFYFRNEWWCLPEVVSGPRSHVAIGRWWTDVVSGQKWLWSEVVETSYQMYWPISFLNAVIIIFYNKEINKWVINNK